jgi:hypothetical protein
VFHTLPAAMRSRVSAAVSSLAVVPSDSASARGAADPSSAWRMDSTSARRAAISLSRAYACFSAVSLAEIVRAASSTPRMSMVTCSTVLPRARVACDCPAADGSFSTRSGETPTASRKLNEDDARDANLWVVWLIRRVSPRPDS